MKVCICFYGIVQRSLKYTIESIETNIFNVLKDNDIEYDIYLHTYNSNFSNSTRSHENNIPIDVEDYKLLNPCDYIVEDYDFFNSNFHFHEYRKYNDPWDNNYDSFDNWIREMNSHYQVTKLWKSTKDSYDFCLYLRADLMYVTPLPLKYLIEKINENKSKNIIFTAPWGTHGGLNDFIAVGTCDSIIYWAERIRSLHEYMEKIGKNSEQMVLYISKKYNLKNIDLHMLFYRVRANGVKHNELWNFHQEHINFRDQCINLTGKLNEKFLY
jgi:hypothetical protein